MVRWKLLAGILVFGSLWGFSECIIGSYLSEIGLPSGIIMTSVFALSLLLLSRLMYRQPGMQIGMGLTAGVLRLFNPFTGCHLCSAIAIMTEGLLFELLWDTLVSEDIYRYKLFSRVSFGILSAYLLYTTGYLVTQVLTPVLSSSFYIMNLLAILPRVFSQGLVAALIGGVITPILLWVAKPHRFTLPDKLYYPATLGVTIFCWLAVIINWL